MFPYDHCMSERVGAIVRLTKLAGTVKCFQLGFHRGFHQSVSLVGFLFYFILFYFILFYFILFYFINLCTSFSGCHL